MSAIPATTSEIKQRRIAELRRELTQLLGETRLDQADDQQDWPEVPQPHLEPRPPSLTERFTEFVNSLSWSRILGILSALATALSAGAALLGNADPKRAALMMAISGTISAFCGRVQGPPKGQDTK